ncbi:MAG: hypothetical protein WBL28_10695 [Methylotenera sp.]
MLKAAVTLFALMLTFTACGEASKPITDGGVTFNQAAADKLTPEQYKKMDIEFFNYIDIKGEFGANKAEQIKDRTDRMTRLAEAGFEPAWLALRLYDFSDYGQPRFRKDYPVYWHQLKKLADSGNASAQCFFSLTARQYAHMNELYRKKGFDMPDLPTQETEETLSQYGDMAAKQGQSYCVGDSAKLAYEKGEHEKGNQLLRQCAAEGNSDCESLLAIIYKTGDIGIPKDNVKALCWFKRAYAHNQSAGTHISMIGAENDVLIQIGSNAKRDLLLSTHTPETDCETASLDWNLLKQKGE